MYKHKEYAGNFLWKFSVFTLGYVNTAPANQHSEFTNALLQNNIQHLHIRPVNQILISKNQITLSKKDIDKHLP
jgi:hypothetical protein